MKTKPEAVKLIGQISATVAILAAGNSRHEQTACISIRLCGLIPKILTCRANSHEFSRACNELVRLNRDSKDICAEIGIG